MKNFYLFLFLLTANLLHAQTTVTETLNHGGIDRTYRLHIPPAAQLAGELPLVFVLHGLGDSGAGIMNGTGFNSLADQQDFFVVYPDAESSVLGTMWNAGVPLSPTVDDVDFISTLIDEVSANYEIDLARVYACGFSMGGFMSHRLGCELSDKITAIASMAGVMSTTIESTCSPSRAVPVFHMHGTADTTVPYDGNDLFGMTSVNTTINKWIENNSCTPTNEVVQVEDTANDGYTFDWWEINECNNDSEIWLYTVNGAGHTWMQNNTDVPTTAKMWEFFERHIMPETPVMVDIALQSEISGNNPPTIGDIISYTLTIENQLENAAATGIIITVEIPSGLTFVSQTSDAGSYSETNNTWSLNTLNASENATLHLQLLVEENNNFTIVSEVVQMNEFDIDSEMNNGDASEDDYTVASFTSTSTNYLIDNDLIKIYPTQVNQSLTIDFNNQIFQEILITDVSGKMLNQIKVNSNTQQTIDVSNLSTGLYILLLQNEKRTLTTQFIKN